MTKRDVMKKTAVGILTLLGLTLILVVLLRDDLGDIASAFRRLSLGDILILTALGGVYQLMDSLVCRSLVRKVSPDFRLRQAVDVIYLGLFGKVSTCGAGTIPMQAFYMHRCGVAVGHGVGIMTLSYVLHKTAVMLYATVLLLAGGGWLRTAVPDIRSYLAAGYLICAAIIWGLLLLCTWGRAHDLAVRLLNRLPDRGRWRTWRDRGRQQLECLHAETRSFLKDKPRMLRCFLFHTIKLCTFCAIPWVCLSMLGSEVLTLGQVELLTALILLITGAVPNVAGMGPVEVVFFLVYKPILGESLATSSLLLFRISTYYVPLVISVVFFLAIQIRFLNRKNKDSRGS